MAGWNSFSDMSDLVGWYKASAITGVADDANFGTWPSSGGVAGNLTGTGGDQPTYKETGLFGLPAVSWSNDKLQSSSFTMPAGRVIISFAGKPNTSGNTGWARIGTTLTEEYPSAKWLTCWQYSDSRPFVGSNNGANRYFAGQAESVASGGIITLMAGAHHGARINGKNLGPSFNAVDQFASDNTSGTAYLTLGQTTTANYINGGLLSEVVIYQDPEHIPWVEGALAENYGITLATGHLFKNDPPNSSPTTYNTSGGARPPINGGLVA